MVVGVYSNPSVAETYNGTIVPRLYHVCNAFVVTSDTCAARGGESIFVRTLFDDKHVVYLLISIMPPESSMNDILRILIVHQEQETAQAILAALYHHEASPAHTPIHASYNVHLASTPDDAIASLILVQPHIVFLDMNCHQDGSFLVLEHSTPSERRFALILLDNDEGGPALRQRHREAVIDFQASGYLLYPTPVHSVFVNSLATSMERARNWLQTQVLAHRHEAVVECLLRAVMEKAETVSGEGDTDSPIFSLRLRSATIRSCAADTPPEQSVEAQNLQANADESSANGTLRLVWSSVIRLEMNDNYYQLWYYDGEGDVQKTLVRKTEVPVQETMPPVFYKAHRSHIVNVRHVAEVNASSLMIRDGAMVPLAGNERQRLQNIVRETSVQMALLHELRGLVVEEEPELVEK
jgi:hypothetical protein